MAETVLSASFFTGFIGASGFGPVFFMVFNRAASSGYSSAVPIILGATLGDFLYFLLSVTSVSDVLSEYLRNSRTVNFAGGSLLISFALISAARTTRRYNRERRAHSISPSVASTIEAPRKKIRDFMMAVMAVLLNPGILFFFTWVTSEFFPISTYGIGARKAIIMASMAAAGAVLSLSLTALIAQKIGAAIGSKGRMILSSISATVIGAVGVFAIFRALSSKG